MVRVETGISFMARWALIRKEGSVGSTDPSPLGWGERLRQVWCHLSADLLPPGLWILARCCCCFNCTCSPEIYSLFLRDHSNIPDRVLWGWNNTQERTSQPWRPKPRKLWIVFAYCPLSSLSLSPQILGLEAVLQRRVVSKWSYRHCY